MASATSEGWQVGHQSKKESLLVSIKKLMLQISNQIAVFLIRQTHRRDVVFYRCMEGRQKNLKETLSSATFVNCAGLRAVVFPPLNIFVLSSVLAEKLYYMYLDQKNPLCKYYSQYTSLSF